MDDKKITKLIEELYLTVADIPTQFLRKAEKMLQEEKISFSEVDKFKRFVAKKQNKSFVKYFNIDKFPETMQKTIKTINRYKLKDDKAPQVDGTLLNSDGAEVKETKLKEVKEDKKNNAIICV